MNINFRPLKHEYCPSRRKITYFQLLIYSQGFATAGSSAYLFFFYKSKTGWIPNSFSPQGAECECSKSCFRTAAHANNALEQQQTKSFN